MKAWVEAQVEAGKYANSSDYVRDLIRRDQESRARQAELQAAIIQGLESGISDRSLDDVLKQARERAAASKNAR